MKGSEVCLSYQKAANAQEAYKIVEAALTPDYLNNFKIKIKLSYLEHEKKIKAEGKGFSLALVFCESECIAELTLSFLLRPMRGKITDRIRKTLSESI